MIGDEDSLAIDFANKITFFGDDRYLPIRGRDHPALPSYVIKLSFELFGLSQLGARTLHVFAGVISVVLVFQLAAALYGDRAALWAAALVSFNEYHIVVSSLATAKGPHLLFVLAATYAFTRLLVTNRAIYLYWTAAFLGLAFYCKEHTVLVLLAFGLTLLLPGHRAWLRSRHTYLALTIFAAMIVPDLVANASVQTDSRLLVQGTMPATYRDHLARVGGLGLNPYPTMFFLRDEVMWVASNVLRYPLLDRTPEYPSMNGLVGLLLLVAVLVRSTGPGRIETRHLVTMFWTVFSFFSLIRPSGSGTRMDTVTWYWTDAVLFPAVVFGGSLLAARRTGLIRLAQAAAVAGMAYALLRMTVAPEWPG